MNEKVDGTYPSPRSSPELSRTKTSESASLKQPQTRERVPLGPPEDPDRFESDEEWKRYHEQEDKVGHWHHLPLVLVALPPVGAIIHGRAENWTDAMILLLVCFYLYHLVRVPWDLYYASRSRRILAASIDGDTSTESDISAYERLEAIHQLQKSELISLAMTIVAPIIGAYLLYFARGMLSDPDRYINRFTISLFALATAVKPLLHLAELFRRRALFYQEVVHYPSTSVHLLQRKIDRLEKDLSQLSRAFATKADVRTLRDGVDIPLTQLSKAVRRYERKEEYARLSSEERFALLDAKLEEATREMMMNAQLVDQLKAEYENAASPLATMMKVLNAMLFHHEQSGGKDIHWWNSGAMFYIFLPLNVSTMAVGWARTKAIEAAQVASGKGSMMSLDK